MDNYTTAASTASTASTPFNSDSHGGFNQTGNQNGGFNATNPTGDQNGFNATNPTGNQNGGFAGQPQQHVQQQATPVPFNPFAGVNTPAATPAATPVVQPTPESMLPASFTNPTNPATPAEINEFMRHGTARMRAGVVSQGFALLAVDSDDVPAPPAPPRQLNFAAPSPLRPEVEVERERERIRRIEEEERQKIRIRIEKEERDRARAPQETVQADSSDALAERLDNLRGRDEQE